MVVVSLTFFFSLLYCGRWHYLQQRHWFFQYAGKARHQVKSNSWCRTPRRRMESEENAAASIIYATCPGPRESIDISPLFFFFFFFFSRCINDKSPLVLCSIQALAYRLPQAASSQRKRCPFALVCLICVCSIPIESVSSSSALSCCAMSCYAMHDRCTCIHGIHGRDDLIRSDLMWCSSRWCLLM